LTTLVGDYGFFFSGEMIGSDVLYADPPNGSVWNSSGNLEDDVDRFARDPEAAATKFGLMHEPAATNLVSVNRLLDDAAWAKTTVAVVETITGADGTSNSASRIIASAANGTLLNTVTGLTSGVAMVFSALLKHAIEEPTLSGPDGNGEYTVTGIPEPTYVKELISGDAFPRERATAGTLSALEWDWTSATGGTLFYGSDPTGTIHAIYGVGVVEMTADGGTSWKPVNAQYLGKTNWSRSFVSFTTTSTSAVVGFRIAEDKHGVFVDCCQLETGTRETSPILTGGATRLEDELVFDLDDGETWTFEWPVAALARGERFIQNVRFTANGDDFDVEIRAWNATDEKVWTYATTITPVTYTAQAVAPVASHYVNTASLFDADSDEFFAYFAMNISAGANTQGIINDQSNFRIRLTMFSNEAALNNLRNAATDFLVRVANAQTYPLDKIIHVFIAAKTTATPVYKMIIVGDDGTVTDFTETPITLIEGTIDFTGAGVFGLGQFGDGTFGLQGHLGPCFMDYRYFDPTDEEVRKNFVRGGRAMDFGDGAKNTLGRGKPGRLAAHFRVGSETVNEGAAGDNTETGTPTYETLPSGA
jgi:hypothetical protein